MVAIVDSIRRSAVEVDQQQSLAGGQFGALVVLPYGCYDSCSSDLPAAITSLSAINATRIDIFRRAGAQSIDYLLFLVGNHHDVATMAR